jgi:hypothetical protein
MLIEEIISEVTGTVMPKVTVANPDAIRANNKALGRKELVIVTPSFRKLRNQQLDKQAAQDVRQGKDQSQSFKFTPADSSKFNPALQPPKNKKPRIGSQ